MLWCHEDQHQGPGGVLIRSDMFVITSWFLLLVWFYQSLKWRKLICSLQILSVSRGVIRIQWSLDSDDTTTWNWLWLEGGQLVRILTSQPGNWNGWIFCTNGDGATVVLYTFIHTSIYHHVSVLCPIMTCCHCSLGLEDNCHGLLKREAPSINITAIPTQ